jgi:uncharacterized protein YndB with AHSA1/START domain
MSEVTMTVIIERPVRDVFAVLTHVENAAKWSRAIEEELTTPGPMAVGSRRRATIPSFARRTTENVMELTEYEANHRLAMRGVSGFPCPVRMTIDLEPLGDGTHLAWVTFIEPRGLLRLAGPLLAAAYKRAFAKDLQTLKSMMESGML